MASHPDCFLNILKCIQDIGVYIWCDENNTYISGWEGFQDSYQPPGTTTTTTSTTLVLPPPTTTSTTSTSTFNCKSPLEYLLNLVNERAEEENETVCEALQFILTQQVEGVIVPIIIPKTENYCCPDCSNVYYLGGAENFVRFTILGGYDIDVYDYTCCTNIFASVETYLKVVEATGPLKTCCNEFQNCIDKLFDHFNSECDGCEYTTEMEILLDLGLVEHSTVGGKSLFCELLNSYVPNIN